MKPTKMIAGLAIAGSLGAGLVTLGTGVATADPGWGPPPRDRNWGPPPPPDGNPPGTWNGGWEPDGGVCLFGACI